MNDYKNLSSLYATLALHESASESAMLLFTSIIHARNSKINIPQKLPDKHITTGIVSVAYSQAFYMWGRLALCSLAPQTLK